MKLESELSSPTVLSKEKTHSDILLLELAILSQAINRKPRSSGTVFLMLAGGGGMILCLLLPYFFPGNQQPEIPDSSGNPQVQVLRPPDQVLQPPQY